MAEENKDNTQHLLANLAVLLAQVVKEGNHVADTVKTIANAFNALVPRVNNLENYVKAQIDKEIKRTQPTMDVAEPKKECCVTGNCEEATNQAV